MGDFNDCVHVFLSEGAGIDAIVREKEAAGEEVPRDAFGHVRIAELNPGKWFAGQLSTRLGADKVLVQKSGYFGRSAAPNARDRDSAHQGREAIRHRDTVVYGVAGGDRSAKWIELWKSHISSHECRNSKVPV